MIVGGLETLNGGTGGFGDRLQDAEIIKVGQSNKKCPKPSDFPRSGF